MRLKFAIHKYLRAVHIHGHPMVAPLEYLRKFPLRTNYGAQILCSNTLARRGATPKTFLLLDVAGDPELVHLVTVSEHVIDLIMPHS